MTKMFDENLAASVHTATTSTATILDPTATRRAGPARPHRPNEEGAFDGDVVEDNSPTTPRKKAPAGAAQACQA